ncbi:hypothetical protein P170DRAFT_469503 [Aspergillus steynii IBT 23096]|uniref:Methyltransferase domain-containing protein n=1 Tax=Aspergillus steynii IBT 23096 TaxID=1392250 RepID=A0A2I2GMD0_9EURO|nr:uncharacterized protein P170DRAFT_469503 [Aspergillus steynii IBT 23096]PLB54033.1 hypothetical protein P170DRAFT_469503 [Aspergillus steynii IBT 23096]
MATPSSGRTHTKLTGTPDYDDPQYWDTKFATGRDVGEWLNPGESLVDAVVSDLETRSSFAVDATPRVLHLGPGISKLGLKLRDAFTKRQWPGNGIVNVDFSAEAVRLGREAESKEDASHAMHWLRADLRSWDDMSALSSLGPFDVILEKSTSDAIATGPSPCFSPETAPADICPTVRRILEHNGVTTMSPVELLGLHLAALTRPGATWATLSYSAMRFDNLGLLTEYWEQVSRTPVKAPQGETSAFAFTPEVFHWIYILRRR